MIQAQRGLSMIEALVVMLIVALVISAGGVFYMGLMRNERQRGAAYQLWVQMNQARVEAVNRNRPCRFLLDVNSRTLSVIDLNSPGTTADDLQLSEVPLQAGVGFGRPGIGAPITLDALTPSQFQATFAQDGTLTSAAGFVGLRDGDRFHRVSVFAGGGIALERWNGTTWQSGG